MPTNPNLPPIPGLQQPGQPLPPLPGLPGAPPSAGQPPAGAAPPAATPPTPDPPQPDPVDPNTGGPPGQIFTPGIGWHMPGQGGAVGGSGWTGANGGFQGQGGYAPNYHDGQTYGGVNPTRVGPITPGSLDGFGQFSDAAYQEAQRRLDPEWQSAERAFRQRMVNQGISEGSEAFDNAWSNFERGRNDSYASARRGSLAEALAAQQQAYNQQYQQSELANRLASQRIGAAASRYGADAGVRSSMYGHDIGRANFLDQLDFNSGQADFSNLMALNNYGNGVTNYNNGLLGYDQGRAGVFNGMIPGVNPGQIDVTGPYQAQYAGQQANAAAQNQAQQAQQQQYMQLAAMAAAMFMSDENSKTIHGEADGEKSLEAIRSMPSKSWTYHGDTESHVGPTAQDFNMALHGEPRTMIAVQDAVGASMGAVKALDAKVSKLADALARKAA